MRVRILPHMFIVAVAEWLKAQDCKSCDRNIHVGSNPTGDLWKMLLVEVNFQLKSWTHYPGLVPAEMKRKKVKDKKMFHVKHYSN
jgi:hypothetical protein